MITGADSWPNKRLRIGLFGRLASGNMGNDVSMEAMLAFLRANHETAVLDAMCNGPESMRSRYGIEATQLFWHMRIGERAPKPLKAVFLALEKCADTFRIMRWVRRHDAVVVPGMGVLEAVLPLRPWETPYSLFVLSVAGRLFRTKVALVSVGASPAPVRTTRWLQNMTARLAHYVSYRDPYSRESMEQRGVDTSNSPLYPDLVFSVPVPPYDAGEERTVGVGVMQYSGSDWERSRAVEINATYVTGMKCFASWLVDNGHRVILLTGDDDDRPVADAILTHLRETRPDLDDTAAVASPVTSFAELTDVMQQVSAVVVTRFHNVICALRLGKPTIALGYGSKSAAVMADAGLSDFNLSANPLDAEQLIERFESLRAWAPELRPSIQASSAVKARLLDDQFARLSKEVFTALPESAGTAVTCSCLTDERYAAEAARTSASPWGWRGAPRDGGGVICHDPGERGLVVRERTVRGQDGTEETWTLWGWPAPEGEAAGHPGGKTPRGRVAPRRSARTAPRGRCGDQSDVAALHCR